ncbi:MAG TPA: TraX family protein [Leptolyngbyaceae cyanobacterium]
MLTSFHIKILAAISMVIDHIGYVFFPKLLIFRIIGRLSFPLFAWLIGEGEKHTKNFNMYVARLIGLGIISQPLYYLLFDLWRPNILAALALGLLAIRLDKITDLKIGFTLLFAGIAQLINAESGAYGVLLIVFLSKFEAKSVRWWIAWIVFNLICVLPLAIESLEQSYQFFAVLAPLFLLQWKGEPGLKTKWFYLFYPLHLAILWGIQFSINKGYYLLPVNVTPWIK